MTFSIIGNGNIAWFFGGRIAAARHRCVGVFGRNPEATRQLADFLLVEKCGKVEDLEDKLSDICLLAVSDNAIPEVASKLKLKKTVLIHTAGAVSIDSIQNAAPDRAVLWPVYSIVRTNPPGHRDIPCAWEASSDRAKRMVQEIGHTITDHLFEARYDQRKWLHISAVISNNFINHLLAICEQICTENKVPFSTLMPIIEQTIERIRQGSPRNLQTGPAARNDENTISTQLNLLENHPAWQKIYEAITESIKNDRNR